MGRLKVVIVEDSASIRSRLVELVGEVDNLQVVGEATTEAAAISMCIDKQPDVIILDMQLEAGTGLGVMKALKLKTVNASTPPSALHTSGTPGTPINQSLPDQSQSAHLSPLVIVLTNFPSPSVQRAAITLGAEYFLDKSLEFHKLPALLNMAAGNTIASVTPT